MRPHSTTRRPITSERIGRALDRVAEIIVAQGAGIASAIRLPGGRYGGSSDEGQTLGGSARAIQTV